MKFKRVTLFVALTLTIVSSTSAGASVNPTWQAAKNADLPSGGYRPRFEW
jgi:hypothetical protein